jgi:putative Mn2+ efflux pump MntP
MSPLALLALAVGLSMDAMAVAATKGLTANRVTTREALRVALLFGAFQAGMPAIGATVGARFAPLIEAWDHWVVFVLLGGIGAKMIVDAMKPAEEHAAPGVDVFAWRGLLLLAVATSIDALAAGLSLPLLEVSIVTALVTIGITTALLSFAGVYLGRRFGERLGKRLDLLGGVILIVLAVKTLIEHLRA